MQKLISTIGALMLCFSLSAQDYSSIDNGVIALGPLANDNVSIITKKITAGLSDNGQKARAIYVWIANNIAADPKTSKNFDQKNILPEQVILLRKSNSKGFANLYQEMASQANIRCLVVEGFKRKTIADINDVYDAPNYAYNVVQLGKSPEQWYYVDAFAAAGTLDGKYTSFTKKYSPLYFFTDKNTFNLDHIAQNEAWQLGAGKYSRKELFSMPVFFSPVYEFGISKAIPVSGLIKGKISKPVSFSFHALKPVEKIEVSVREGKKVFTKPIEFTQSGQKISFTYKFEKSASGGLYILINGKEAIGYQIEMEE